MLARTSAAGIVDAVGHLRLDQVLAGDLTGDAVVLGMAATGRTALPVLGPVVAPVSLLVGAAVAGQTRGPPPRPWQRMRRRLAT
jgi:uncharacterized membrane protein YoaK (UPF0700 family)